MDKLNAPTGQMLRHYVSPSHHDWDEHVDMAESAINDAWHESVQGTPFMLNHGQHPLHFLSLQIHAHKSYVLAAAAFTANIQLGAERVIACLMRAQQRQKATADGRRRNVDHQVG